MKSIQRLLYITATGAMLGLTACKKDFLEENLITARSTQDFETKAGLDGLVTGLYQSLRFHFNYEWAYTTTNYGVDEFTVGGDRTMQMWNSYDGNLNSLTGDAAAVWDNMYGAINSANIVIQNVPLFYDDASTKDIRLGEGYFMRAFNYFKLVKQYGGVPLKLKPSTTVEFEFPRNTIQETYEQVIADFKKATELLPPTAAQRGRITKWAAAHFLAKVYLFRASELNGNVPIETCEIIKYVRELINSQLSCISGVGRRRMLPFVFSRSNRKWRLYCVSKSIVYRLEPGYEMQLL